MALSLAFLYVRAHRLKIGGHYLDRAIKSTYQCLGLKVKIMLSVHNSKCYHNILIVSDINVHLVEIARKKTD